jgi:autotransporter-associated beta strand protein
MERALMFPVRSLRQVGTTASIFVALIALAIEAHAQTVTWGFNGAGGDGTWDQFTPNWFDGSQNFLWPSGGDAVFAGVSGGGVIAAGPVVSSMTFNTPGYSLRDSLYSGDHGLTITTNEDATIWSTFFESTPGSVLIKDGPATLTFYGINFLDTVQVEQGEMRFGFNSLRSSAVNLADAPGVTLSLLTAPRDVIVRALTGGGAAGGVVRPNEQSGTVTLHVDGGGIFGGRLEDNGSGILAVDQASSDSWTLTNTNSHSGTTKISSQLTFAGNGSAANSSIRNLGTLSLDNSDTVVADRVSDSLPFNLLGGDIQLKGNAVTPVEEVIGQLNFYRASKIVVSQPGSAATQLTFGDLERDGHATLNIDGSGVGVAGLANNVAGTLSPFITSGNEWATVGNDNRITTFYDYAAEVNSGLPTDHVKLSNSGTTALEGATIRASLNLKNSGAAEQVLDLAGNSLTLTTGGILSSGSGASSIRNGTLSTTAGEMVITANNDLTIGAAIVNGGSGATALTKSGPGALTLAGTNSYTGPTAIVEGSLIVASDASLGLGSTIELNGGTLVAAASFSSPKGFSVRSGGSIDTAGFDLDFSGPTTAAITKEGLGTLTLSGPLNGSFTVDNGVLNLVNATNGTVDTLWNFHPGSLAAEDLILDIGGPAAATLTTEIFFPDLSLARLRIEFGIGNDASDLWKMNSGLFFLSDPGDLQFAFHNLGGVTTDVDYQLISYVFPHRRTCLRSLPTLPPPVGPARFSRRTPVFTCASRRCRYLSRGRQHYYCCRAPRCRWPRAVGCAGHRTALCGMVR